MCYERWELPKVMQRIFRNFSNAVFNKHFDLAYYWAIRMRNIRQKYHYYNCI